MPATPADRSRNAVATRQEDSAEEHGDVDGRRGGGSGGGGG